MVSGPLTTRQQRPATKGIAVLRAATQDLRYTNPIGVHALVWTADDWRKAVAGSKKTGFNLVEVPVFEPETLDTATTRRVFEEYNLEASASLGLRPDADVSNEDKEVAAAGQQLLTAAVKAVAACGGRYLCGPIYSAIHKYPAPMTMAGYNNAVAALKDVSVLAADLGVMLGLEVINRYETNVLNTAAQAMDMIADIGADNVMVHLDTYHMNIEERSMWEAIHTCKDRLGYVHIGESHRGYLGTGSVDFQGCFHALAAVDYRGPLTFESFSSTVVSPILSNNLCIWRNLWDSSEDLAGHAHSFIDQHWSSALKSREQQ